MPNSPKEILNINLADLSTDKAAEAKQTPVSTPSVSNPASASVSSAQKVANPTTPTTNLTPPPIPNQKPTPQTKAKSTPADPATVSDGYIYSKSTIGGIDRSKLEYKETFKKRVYFNVPKHTYSWVILFILIILGLGVGIAYYLYPKIFTSPSTDLAVQAPTETIPPVVLQEDPGLRDKLLQVKAPFLLTNDEIINQLKNAGANLNSNELNPILSTEMLDKITFEFKQLQTIIEENNAQENPPATDTPTGQNNQTTDQNQSGN